MFSQIEKLFNKASTMTELMSSHYGNALNNYKVSFVQAKNQHVASDTCSKAKTCDFPHSMYNNTPGPRKKTRWGQPSPQYVGPDTTMSSTVYCERWTTRQNIAHPSVSTEPLTNGSYHARLNMCKQSNKCGTSDCMSCDLHGLSTKHLSSCCDNDEDSFKDATKDTNIHGEYSKRRQTTNAQHTCSKFYCGVKFKSPCIGLHMAMRGERIKLRRYMLHEVTFCCSCLKQLSSCKSFIMQKESQLTITQTLGISVKNNNYFK